MTDPLNEFKSALESAGYRLPPGKAIEPDDSWHRLIYMDEKTSSGRYRVKYASDDFAIGGFGSDKDPAGFHKWHSSAAEGKRLTPEQRAEIRRVAEADAELKRQELKRKQDRISDMLSVAVRRLPVAESDHAYLRKKQIGVHGVRYRKKGHELVVPIFDMTGAIVNVQRIPGNGWKGFFKGARINGGCYPIGIYDGIPGSPLIICEGLATGASIYESTKIPVRVAFNTSNLIHLAQSLKEKYPEAFIIFCADNDAWTFKPGKKPDGVKPQDVKADEDIWQYWRDEGFLWNPGIEKAQKAAVSIGGAAVIWPEFDNITGKPTDFNDLHQRNGAGAVMSRIEQALPRPESIYNTPDPAEEPDLVPDYPDYDRAEPASPWPFKILGYDDGVYHFLPMSSGQIFSSTAAGLGSIVNLFRLANLDFWNDHFNVNGKLSTRKVAELAASALMEQAHEIGIFTPAKMRGAGAWMDQQRPVIHCGSYLLVNGVRVSPHRFESRYVYPLRSADFPAGSDVLPAREAVKLREICGQISWESKLSGDLLAGWIVIAPVCGALEWRPHIWVEGESESGKSTVINRILRPLLNGVSQRFDGGTTEASIRQVMGIDALPVIYDEAEPENVKDRIIMDGLLLLARRASSGGIIAKGGSGGKADIFNVRSCFCFAGINPAIKQRADESRISRLVIKKAVFDGADQFYKDLKERIRATLTREFASGLVARTIANLPTLISNSEIFTDAAADVLTSRRAADQIGPMLAGLFLLTSDRRIDYDQAVAFIRKHDWTMHTAIAEASDPERLITYISTATVRFRNGEISIGELISRAYSALYDRSEEADPFPGQFLRTLGIWVRPDGVLFANKSPPLERILASTAWISWSRPLKDIDGAEHVEPLKFSTGLNSRSVRVPLKAFGIEEIPL